MIFLVFHIYPCCHHTKTKVHNDVKYTHTYKNDVFVVIVTQEATRQKSINFS